MVCEVASGACCQCAYLRAGVLGVCKPAAWSTRTGAVALLVGCRTWTRASEPPCLYWMPVWALSLAGGRGPATASSIVKL